MSGRRGRARGDRGVGSGRGDRGVGSGRGRGRGGHRGRGGYHSRGASNSDFNNGSGHNDGQEMNAHLTERFQNSFAASSRFHSKKMDEAAMSGLEVSLNPRIREYFSKQKAVNHQQDVEKWLTAPEVPTHNEILLDDDEPVVLTTNRIDKPYKSIARYLKTHYTLLREDAVSPLREAIDKFRMSPEMMDNRQLSIYEKVHIRGFTFTQNGIAARIKFSTRRAERRIPWLSSKRLTSGTMVALSPIGDKFKTRCIVAIVAARPFELLDQAGPEIDIYFSQPEDTEIDPQLEFVMIEAKQGYYESHRHTLRAIQKMSDESFPLSDLITVKSTKVDTPQYRSDLSNCNLSAAYVEEARHHFANVDIINGWPESSVNTTLDTTQWGALEQMLTKNLAVVQGPPGTGKTHVSKIALQIMSESRSATDPPIIIAAQTNHALDQLLEHISEFDDNYVRLGGRSTHPEIRKHALFEIRLAERIPNIPGSSLGFAKRQLGLLHIKFGEILSLLDESSEPISAETLFKLGIITDQQRISLDNQARNWVSNQSEDLSAIRHWLPDGLTSFEVVYHDDNFGIEALEEDDLEFEQIKETEAEHGVNDEEDIEQLKGPWKTVVDKWKVDEHSEFNLERAKQLLDTKQNLWDVPEYLRGAMYTIMQQRAKCKALSRFREAAKEYEGMVEELKIGKWEKDAIYLKRAHFIGLTTTGLSKYRPLIASLEPKVILIEEAAEVIEGPVTAGCMESLQHLILVGDHKQLQGHCSVRELEQPPYNLNVSMFERLVKLGMPYQTLLRQRRMAPEIRQLISTIYPSLQDHHHVWERQTPPDWGMGPVHSFFFKHSWHESKDSHMSTFNEEEARLVAKFYRHLIRNGAPSTGITILTFYNGQRKQILRELKKDPETALSYNKVKTVDSYQGEENNIVILSLVRNNTEGKIGFLEVDNRVCVALSRAKFGFYIFGNAEMLSDQSALWADVKKFMSCAEPQRIGHRLPTTCREHKRTIHIQYPEDFDKTRGGCDRMCGGTLDCGHPCPDRCHPYLHESVKCQQLCNRPLVCGHRCRCNCHENCWCDCPNFEEADNRVALSKSHDGLEYQQMSTCTDKNDYAAIAATTRRPPIQQTVVGGSSTPHGFRNAGFGRQKLARGGGAFQPSGNTVREVMNYHEAGTPSSDSGKVAVQPTEERPSAKWRAFAEGGVKEDDRLRLVDQIANSKSTCHDQDTQADLLCLSPPESTKGSIVGKSVARSAGEGRSRWITEYNGQPAKEQLPEEMNQMSLID